MYSACGEFIMDWSSECVLEFVELLQGEPCIWNPKNKKHKNRNLVNDAWIRIKDKFSVPCSIEELKKKRNSLLTQYRECLKKIKESTTTGAGAEDIYKPSWFAFDAFHSYMGVVYDYRSTLSTVNRESTEERSLLHEIDSEESNNGSLLSHTSNTERPLSRESNSRSESDSFSNSKRQRGVQDLLVAKKQMDEAFSIIKNRSNRKENEKQVNACDLYGQLLSEKLKPLDEDDRLGLMNEIDNLVFRYIMNVRKRNSSRKTHLPSTQLAVNNQPVDLGPSTLFSRPPVASSQGNMQNLESILNYEVPFKTSTPFQMESQLSPQQKALSNYAVQISLPEAYLSPDSAVGNYTVYPSNHNVLFDPNIPSTSNNPHKKPKVSNDKKIKVLSETVISPPGKRNIIEEAYVRCSDDDDSPTNY